MGAPATVLIVDDDPGFLGLTARIVADLGAENVVTAANAARALDVAAEWRPWAALVDIGLPDRSGAELGKMLAVLPWRPRVVLTSSDSEVFRGFDTPAEERLPFVAKIDLSSETLARTLLGR